MKKGILVQTNIILSLVLFLLFSATSVNAQKKRNDGTNEETSTIGELSKYQFIDPADIVVRGHIDYTEPKKYDDGISVGNAEGLCDLETLYKFMNKVEKKNEDFKAGKGEKRKSGKNGKKKNTSQPDIIGNIDGVLIAKDGKLIIEEYFGNANIDRPHYQMSITKSITANAIGKCIDMGLIDSEDDLILKYLPEVDKSKIAKGAETLTIKDLLTMQSGIRFKGNAADIRQKLNMYTCAELYLTYTNPIPEKKKYKYDGTNPSILQHVIYNVSGLNLEDFNKKYIFGPMGITNFSFKVDNCGLNAGAAGMELRSRDMLKIGLMMNNGGVYNGKRILSEDWVNRATTAYANKKSPHHKYGYFWWGQDVVIDGKTYDVKSARGAGGQFIFMVKDLDLVVVFTSYYAKQDGIKLMESLIIPSFVNK